MKRRESREQAFALLFEKLFNDAPVAELAAAAMEARETSTTAFALRIAQGAEEHLDAIDEKIDAYSKNWNKNRISRVALSVMRLAVYEMLYDEEVPVNVAISEAVELAKIYGGDEDAAFINGVLGSIAREQTESV